jgi:hypothetical protein
LEGRVSGATIGKLIGGSGKIGIIVSDINSVNHALRRKGLLSMLSEKYPGIVEVETASAYESGDETYRLSLEMMKRYPDLKVIYEEGGKPQFAAKAVVDANREGKTIVVCHDVTPETMEYVARGTIGGTLSQDPYVQGYNPIIHIYNHIVAGWEPAAPRFLTNLESVNRDNYRKFWNPEAKDGRSSDAAGRSGLAQISEKRSGRPLKIAVLSISDSEFWAPVAQGARDAGVILASRNAHVKYIIPKASSDGLLSASTFAPVIGDIANQTNVLAINASIQAVRAGERGKGFSILAGEIRKLAEQSTRSAMEIDGLIGEIRNNVNIASAETMRGAEEVRRYTETAKKSEASLEEINNLAHENELKMGTIFAAVEAMQAFSRKVAASMHTLAEANAKSTRAVDEIVASAGEMSVQAVDVAKTAQALSEMAKGQQVLLSQFRLDGE